MISNDNNSILNLKSIADEATAVIVAKCGTFQNCLNCDTSCKLYKLGNALFNADVEKSISNN